MGNTRSVGLTDKYKAYRKRRIVYMREAGDEPVGWPLIAKQFGICYETARKIYKEAKREQEGKD